MPTTPPSTSKEHSHSAHEPLELTSHSRRNEDKENNRLPTLASHSSSMSYSQGPQDEVASQAQAQTQPGHTYLDINRRNSMAYSSSSNNYPAHQQTLGYGPSAWTYNMERWSSQVPAPQPQPQPQAQLQPQLAYHAPLYPSQPLIEQNKAAAPSLRPSLSSHPARSNLAGDSTSTQGSSSETASSNYPYGMDRWLAQGVSEEPWSPYSAGYGPGRERRGNGGGGT
ncbi:hypothetical protein MMC16_003689 [Acarospora aff. strigata]|nr:hypothetical protein [Acarospora aff. strigata]